MRKISNINNFLKTTTVIVVAIIFAIPGTTVLATQKQQKTDTVHVMHGTLSDNVMIVENTSGTAGDTGHVINIRCLSFTRFLLNIEHIPYYGTGTYEKPECNYNNT